MSLGGPLIDLPIVDLHPPVVDLLSVPSASRPRRLAHRWVKDHSTFDIGNSLIFPPTYRTRLVNVEGTSFKS